MGKRLLPVLLGLASACAQASLDDAPSDVPRDAAADAPVEAAVLDAPPIDVPPPIDAPPPIDGPTELTEDVPAAMDSGADAPAPLDAGSDVPSAVDAGVDAPVVPTDNGWGPTGYRVVRSDPAARWVDACAQPGHQTVLMDVDDGSFRTALPFAFRYWGQPLSEGAPVVVSPNGYLTFQPSAPTPANGIIPNRLDGVDAVIAAQWRDLRTRSAGVCLAVLGNPGARQWVIQWSDARYYTSIFGHLNFEVVLNESSDAIDLNYGSMTLSEPATVALESWDGSRSAVPFTIPQPIVFSDTRARFLPQ